MSAVAGEAALGGRQSRGDCHGVSPRGKGVRVAGPLRPLMPRGKRGDGAHRRGCGHPQRGRRAELVWKGAAGGRRRCRHVGPSWK